MLSNRSVNKRWFRALLGSMAGIGCAGALAASCDQESVECVEVGEWSFSLAMGAGVRENPVTGQDDLPLILLPSLRYYGKRLSLENYDLAYLLAESKHHELSAVATLSMEHMFFNDASLGNFVIEGNVSAGSGGQPSFESSPGFVDSSESSERDVKDFLENSAGPSQPDPAGPVPIAVVPPENLRDRNLAALSGVEYGYYIKDFHLSVQALQDISSVHEGQELRAALSWQAHTERNYFSASTGVLWKSGEAMNYYYGITEKEASDQSLHYKAEADKSYFMRLGYSRKLSERWRLKSVVYYRNFSEQAYRSPLIEKRSVATFFVGGEYHF